MAWKYRDKLESRTSKGLFLLILREIKLDWDDVQGGDLDLSTKPVEVFSEGRFRLFGEILGDFVLTFKYDWRRDSQITIDTDDCVKSIAHALKELAVTEEGFLGDITVSEEEEDDWEQSVDSQAIKRQFEALDFAPFVPSAEEIVEHFGVDEREPFVVKRLFGAPCLAWVDENDEPQAVMHPKESDVDKAVRALSRACIVDVRKDVLSALKKLK